MSVSNAFLNDLFSSSRPGLPIIRGFSAALYSMPTFKGHISVKLHKVYTKSCALRRIRRSISSNILMLRLCKSFTLPHLQYCSPLFLGVGGVSWLEHTNYCILTTLLGGPGGLPFKNYRGSRGKFRKEPLGGTKILFYERGLKRFSPLRAEVTILKQHHVSCYIIFFPAQQPQGNPESSRCGPY